ncbi:hypothetical protein LINPERPRIM_LOCUS35995 [Linum perenne]
MGCEADPRVPGG